MQGMDQVTIKHQNILSMSAIAKPLPMTDILSTYSDVFDGTGKLERKYHLAINPEITPVVHHQGRFLSPSRTVCSQNCINLLKLILLHL